MRDIGDTQLGDDQHTPDQWRGHITAINTIIDRWRAGEFSTAEKRQAIAAENLRYYGDAAPAWMTRAGRRYDGRRR